MEGTLSTGMEVQHDGHRRENIEVLECGLSAAHGHGALRDALTAGEVGYFTASIKNVKDTRVGDTITEAEPTCCGAAARLSSRPSPWCIAAFIPADGSKYPDLRDALEKLQLNDACAVL